MSATMKDVANRAGISLGTVSNYINGKIGVSEEKKIKIEQAIKELGYTVNIAARSLKSNCHKSIGVLIPNFGNMFLVKVIEVIETLLAEKGYSIIAISYSNNADIMIKQLQYLSARVDGIVFVPRVTIDSQVFTNIQDNTPIITFDELADNVICDKILVNNTQIVKEAITRLLDKGHTKIGLIAGPEMAYTTFQRIMGYKIAYKEKNIDIDKSLIYCADYTKDSGISSCSSLMKQHSDVTAILSVGYKITLGAIAAINKINKQNDIELVGYDASDIEDILSYRMGYIYQPYEQIAENIVDIILKRVNMNYEDFPLTVKIEAEIRNMK